MFVTQQIKLIYHFIHISGGSRISRGGHQPHEGGQRRKCIICHVFAKNCMIIKKIGLRGGCASLANLLDPALNMCNGIVPSLIAAWHLYESTFLSIGLTCMYLCLGRAPRVQILSFSCIFLQKNANLGVVTSSRGGGGHASLALHVDSPLPSDNK